MSHDGSSPAAAAGAALGTAPEPNRTAQFVFAREFGERASDVNRFYNGFTGKNRSLEAYRWEFLSVPAGLCLMWTITEASTQRIVGHHSIIPTPLVRRGVDILAGRTENTIVDPAVRTKIFYPGMEKKALAEAVQRFCILYTIHSTGPRALRLRFGYKPIGRWTVYLAKAGPGYLRALLERGRDALAPRIPDVLLAAAATVAGRVYGMGRILRRGARHLVATEIDDVAALGDEYVEFWSRARRGYDLTIDRSLDFLRWRVTDNPHLRFRTWTLRELNQLHAVVIGHRHVMGTAAALYIDDIIVGEYSDAAFEAVLACMPELDPRLDAVMLMTLAVDTPLHRALQRRFPLQSFLLKRLGPRLFDDMLALDTAGVAGDAPWYVTPIFTEGMDTSR